MNINLSVNDKNFLSIFLDIQFIGNIANSNGNVQSEIALLKLKDKILDKNMKRLELKMKNLKKGMMSRFFLF